MMNQGGGNPLVSMIIRPPRNTYPDDTGTTLTQEVGGVTCQIHNIAVRNSKNEQIKCTFISPVPIQQPEGQPPAQRPCVVYCHGNAGNKIEGLLGADTLIPAGLDLLSFDFSGCGNSDGKWVTLGWKETDDLRSVLQYLKD
jgi:pimeloyl-ACP methyl ester carboxylesterase